MRKEKVIRVEKTLHRSMKIFASEKDITLRVAVNAALWTFLNFKGTDKQDAMMNKNINFILNDGDRR